MTIDEAVEKLCASCKSNNLDIVIERISGQKVRFVIGKNNYCLSEEYVLKICEMYGFKGAHER